MALADLAAKPATRPARECSICWLLRTLPKEGEDGADALAGALATGHTHQAISYELAKSNHQVTAQSIGRHRRGLCAGSDL